MLRESRSNDKLLGPYSLDRSYDAIFRQSSLDSLDVAFAPFKQPHSSISPYSPLYPWEFFKNVLPIACHSHNDYWRSIPLYSALGSGCISVEADVWLKGEQLLVGHTSWSLDDQYTLENMYLGPLLEILDVVNGNDGEKDERKHYQHGVFYMDPGQTLTLLIDFKSDGIETWPFIKKALEPLSSRSLLTHWNGTHRVLRPITVVASGNAPFHLINASSDYRDVFFDAPLDALVDPQDPPNAVSIPVGFEGQLTPQHLAYKYNPSNSHFASVNFGKAIGQLGNRRLSSTQEAKLQGQIQSAVQRGLIPRYWGTPIWPRGLRDAIWALLIKEKVGLLNVDDLRAARKGGWGVWLNEERRQKYLVIS